MAAIPEKDRAKLIKSIPVGAARAVDEIARAVQSLLDDDAGYIARSVIFVNGGLDM